MWNWYRDDCRRWQIRVRHITFGDPCLGFIWTRMYTAVCFIRFREFITSMMSQICVPFIFSVCSYLDAIFPVDFPFKRCVLNNNMEYCFANEVFIWVCVFKYAIIVHNSNNFFLYTKIVNQNCVYFLWLPLKFGLTEISQFHL